jgi:hypothetical protein
VIEPLRPARGGFLRPLGCGWFIQEFLAGRGPMGSPKIDTSVGAPMTDIHYQYKLALMRTWAEDMVAREGKERVKRKLSP